MRNDIAKIINVFLIVAIVFYGYYIFFHPKGLEYVYRNWDGPAYAVVGRTLYDANEIEKINPFPYLPAWHYANRFPGYGLAIRLFSFLGYSESMIVVSQLFALAYSIALYFLVKEVSPKANALFVAITSIFFTPRWFIVSHVGSTEPMFLLFITLFALYFHKKQYWISALFAALAQVTKPQGIIFFIGISLYFLWKRQSLKAFLPYLLIPLSLVTVFTIYYLRFGDFFVFLRSEAFPTMQWPPLKILTSPTVYSAVIDLFVVWKEAIVYTYLVYAIGIAFLFEKKLYMLAIVSLTYFMPVLLFVQTDMARFIQPILPFVMLGLSDFFSKKPVFLTILLTSPMAILYAVGYINYNLAPYPATLFLK